MCRRSHTDTLRHTLGKPQWARCLTICKSVSLEFERDARIHGLLLLLCGISRLHPGMYLAYMRKSGKAEPGAKTTKELRRLYRKMWKAMKWKRFSQVRLHGNYAASSVAADCIISRRPPAEKSSLNDCTCKLPLETGFDTHTHRPIWAHSR